MRTAALALLALLTVAVLAWAQAVVPPTVTRAELPGSVDLRAAAGPYAGGGPLMAVRVLLAPTYVWRTDVRWQALLFTSAGPRAVGTGACEGALLRLWVDDGLGHRLVGGRPETRDVPPDRWTLLSDVAVSPVFYAGGAAVTFTLRMEGGGCARFILGHEAVPRNVPGIEGGGLRAKSYMEAVVTPLPR